MSVIKALLLDADGVLVVPQLQFSIRLEQEYGISPAVMGEFFSGPFRQCMLGVSSLSEVLPEYLPKWGWEGTLGAFIQAWLESEHRTDERFLPLVHNLRRSGVVCCLATNQEKYRAEYMKTEMGFSALFDRLFFSNELGCLKPGEAFFQHIEDRLGFEAESLVFWDDSRTNVEAALRRGWEAALYTDFEGFVKSMKTTYKLVFTDNCLCQQGDRSRCT